MPTESSRFLLMPLIIVFVAVSLVGAAMYTPSLPAIASDLGARSATVQLTITVYLVGFAVAQLFVGPLSDRFGRKPVLAGGFALFVASSAACALAGDVGFLIAARAIQALGASVGLVLSRAIVGDRFGYAQSVRYMAYLGIAAGLTPALSPILGGVLEVAFSWRGVFYTMAGLGVVALLAALFVLGESHPPHKRIAPGPRVMIAGFALLVRNRNFLAYTVMAGASTTMFFVFLGAGPIVMIGSKGVTPDVYGLYAASMPVGYIIGNFLSSRVLPRIGIDRGITAGILISLAGASAMALAGLAGPFSPAAFALPLAAIGFGHGILVPAVYSGVVSTEPHIAGTASGFAGFLQFAIAAALSPLSAIARHGSLVEMGGLLVGLALAGALAYRMLRRGGEGAIPDTAE